MSLTDVRYNAFEFSQQQIKLLVRRNELMQKYMQVTGQNMGAVTISGHLASDRMRSYVLVKNEDGRSGWTMRLAGTSSSSTDTKTTSERKQEQIIEQVIKQDKLEHEATLAALRSLDESSMLTSTTDDQIELASSQASLTMQDEYLESLIEEDFNEEQKEEQEKKEESDDEDDEFVEIPASRIQVLLCI
jgi:hypothetical protein